MGVRAVSLSTHDLSAASLTLYLNTTGIRSLIDPYKFPHKRPFSALPPMVTNKGYTKIYFGENQLSPGSFGMSPLTTSHLNPLLRIRVRSSCRFSSAFNLLMVSSPGFGSFVASIKKRPFKACFHCAFPRYLVRR